MEKSDLNGKLGKGTLYFHTFIFYVPRALVPLLKEMEKWLCCMDAVLQEEHRLCLLYIRGRLLFFFKAVETDARVMQAIIKRYESLSGQAVQL